MRKQEPEGINFMNRQDKGKTQDSLSNFKRIVYYFSC